MCGVRANRADFVPVKGKYTLLVLPPRHAPGSPESACKQERDVFADDEEEKAEAPEARPEQSAHHCSLCDGGLARRRPRRAP